jgi:CheY-like chemotaxis protein
VITVLAVGDRSRARELDDAAARHPSLELLHAADVEEALDRLARNRRIDAVLLLVGADAAREIARTVLEEDPAAPPMFLPAPTAALAGVRPLSAGTPQELLQSIVREVAG